MLERVCILVLGTLIGLMLGMIESTLTILRKNDKGD